MGYQWTNNISSKSIAKYDIVQDIDNCNNYIEINHCPSYNTSDLAAQYSTYNETHKTTVNEGQNGTVQNAN